MLLKFGTPCRSRARLLGTLAGLIVEPAEKLLLKVVVEEPRAEPLVRVRIPFGRLEQADADQVAIGLGAPEYDALVKAEVEAADRRRSGVRKRRGDEPTEHALTHRTKVECRDGEIGTLVAVVLDARSGELESVIVPIGVHVMRDLVVPVKLVTGLRDDLVTLSCDMNDLGEYPSLR